MWENWDIDIKNITVSQLNHTGCKPLTVSGVYNLNSHLQNPNHLKGCANTVLTIVLARSQSRRVIALPEEPRVVCCAAGQEGVGEGAGLRVEVARHDAGHAPEGAASARPGGLLGAEPVQL